MQTTNIPVFKSTKQNNAALVMLGIIISRLFLRGSQNSRSRVAKQVQLRVGRPVLRRVQAFPGMRPRHL